jgi:acetolactate synthase-1/2/3 large subunit
MDSSPVVFITCNVGENLIGKDSFQEVDIIGISMPITKCNYLVRDASKIADVMREAFAIAAGGRPGPVLIDIPKNITAAEAEYFPLPRSEHINNGRLASLNRRSAHGFKVLNPNQEDIDRLLEMIEESKKPMIMAGGGVIRSDASDELLEFAEKLDAPVTATVMGLGGFPGNHPLYTGMIGMHGARVSNLASCECDLLIAVGARFSDRVIGNAETFAKNARIVHIDIDRAEVDKNIVTDHHIIGDAKRVLKMLNEKMPKYARSGWLGEVASLGKPANGREKKTMDPQDIIETIYDATGGDAIIVTDVGQHQMWCAQYYKYSRPKQFITSGGFGTMGFGLGAAIGAKIGNPGKVVIHATGDGCFRMNCHELT